MNHSKLLKIAKKYYPKATYSESGQFKLTEAIAIHICEDGKFMAVKIFKDGNVGVGDPTTFKKSLDRALAFDSDKIAFTQITKIVDDLSRIAKESKEVSADHLKKYTNKAKWNRNSIHMISDSYILEENWIEWCSANAEMLLGFSKDNVSSKNDLDVFVDTISEYCITHLHQLGCVKNRDIRIYNIKRALYGRILDWTVGFLGMTLGVIPGPEFGFIKKLWNRFM